MQAQSNATGSNYCHHCQVETLTVYRILSSGHCGNLCGSCGTARKGKPYVSKAEYFNITAKAGHGRRQINEQRR